jgi:hypothetical protein
MDNIFWYLWLSATDRQQKNQKKNCWGGKIFSKISNGSSPSNGYFLLLSNGDAGHGFVIHIWRYKMGADLIGHLWQVCGIINGTFEHIWPKKVGFWIVTALYQSNGLHLSNCDYENRLITSPASYEKGAGLTGHLWQVCGIRNGLFIPIYPPKRSVNIDFSK